MGLEVFPYGGEEVWVLSDRDRPVPKTLGDDGFRDAVLALPDLPFVVDGFRQTSWALVSGDWNGDGHADLFVTFGTVGPTTNPARTRNTFLLSDPATGQLAPAGEQLPTQDPEDFRDPVFDWYRSSRGAIRIDIDQDGTEEIIVANTNLPPHILGIRGTPRRCTIEPVPREVLDAGGYRIERADGVWVPVNVHGENLTHDGRYLLADSVSGRVQFPSGARVPFACSETGRARVTVEEPAWLEAAWASDTLSLTVDASVLARAPSTVGIWLRTESGDVWRDAALVGDAWVVEGVPRLSTYLIRLDSRWVARWRRAR
jgi:hypothetical protein